MRISVISAVLVCLVSPAGRADPVARPADSWEQYDLIAKVVVRSIDETREILTYESTEARTFAHPAKVEVVEPLPEELKALLTPSVSLSDSSLKEETFVSALNTSLLEGGGTTKS